MNNAVFEYGGHSFQPYAKYKANRHMLEQFINYGGELGLPDSKFNKEDFYRCSPIKNCDVFYCIDESKLYIPTGKGLIEFFDAPILELCKARMMNDYEIIHSFYVGEREVIVGEDKNAEYRYFCGYYETNDIFSRAVDCQMSDDYLEIMQIYCDRTKEQVELFRAKQIKGAKLVTSDMCNPCKSDTDLTKKIVVLKPETLRREYQNGNHQLFYVTGGNGSKPNSRGTKVFGYYLNGKKETYIRRYEIMGTIEAEKLPEWAKKHINKIMKDKSMEERN